MNLEQMAQKIDAEIKESGMTKKHISEKAGINQMTLQRYFNLCTISLENLFKICNVLKLEIVIRKKGDL